MCGIAGIVASSSDVRVDPAVIHAMCQKIVYRGPDDEGMWVSDNVGLGMRRLSIIDLSGGKQPVSNEDGSVIAVFNGEIYNFAELRANLIKAGHAFASNCDSEVIVHLYEQLDTAFIDRLRGMFAIALYDRSRRRLVLARDRLGKKPLHYALHNGALYFGSEIKSLIAAAPDLAAIHHGAIADYFHYGYIPDSATVFRKVNKLPPGHVLEYSAGHVSIRKYWDLPPFATLHISEAEAMERLEAIFTEAVRLRLVSDVPLGALLSGGVDSSAIVAMMARLSAPPVKTFNICFSNSDFDESNHANLVAKTFGTDHHQLEVKPELWDTARYLTGIMDEPFADSSLIPTYLISKLARQHVTVALSGDGGDELFAGYDWYTTHYQRRWIDHLPRCATQFYSKVILPRLPTSISRRKLATTIGLNARDRYIRGMSMAANIPGLLTKDFGDIAERSRASQSVAQTYFDSAPACDLVSRMQYCDIHMYLAADILTKVDRASMAASLETRAPLLDHVFAEFATQLPVAMKLGRGARKYLLKRLAERLGVPHEVLHRPKQGFALPLVHWFRSGMRQTISDLLLDPRTIQRGYTSAAAVTRLLDEHRAGIDHSAILWQLMIFELWHRNFLERLATTPETALLEPAHA
jgi:asparagine synthase (glutamine-hydrolysing)